MTQDNLIQWIEAHGCTITHSKGNYHRAINENGQAMGIPAPRDGEEFLQPMTVCRICYMLKVPMPDYAKDAFEAYREIQKTQHGTEI